MDVSMYEPYTSYACCDDSNVFFSTSILPCHHMVMKWSWYLGCYHPLLSFRIYVSSIHLHFFSHCFCYSPTSPFALSKRFCHRSLFSSLLECLDCLGWLWLHFLLVFVSHKAANSALAGLLVPFATDTRCRIWSVTKKSSYCIASKCHCIARKEERESLEVQWKPKSSKHRDGRTSISSAGSSTYLFKSMRAQNENTIRVVFDEVSSFHPWLHASTQWKGVELRADTLPYSARLRNLKGFEEVSLLQSVCVWLMMQTLLILITHKIGSLLVVSPVSSVFSHLYCKFALRSATPRPPRDKMLCLSFRFRK